MPTTRSPAGDAAAEFAALEKRIVDHFFVLQPAYAVFLGLHRYDGKVPDLSKGATAEWVTLARGLLKQLEGTHRESLPKGRRLDWTLLDLLLEGAIFDLAESRDYDRNPMAFIGQVSVTSYMVREYAPAADRVRAIVRVLEGVPRLMEQGLSRFDPHVPKPFLQLTEAMASGIPGHLAEAEDFARKSAPELAEELAGARTRAAQAVEAFMGKIRSHFLPAATPEFALGPEKFQRLLWVREGIREPAEEILAQGVEDLRRNQARLRELAGGWKKGGEVKGLLEELLRDHPTADQLLPKARAFVDEARAFVVDRHLATIPTPDHCRVEETPSYGRALSTASMNPPGPFEGGGDEGIYYVTPVDATWTAQQAEEWLRSFNDALLRNVTIHEVYPGHYLQFLHFRKTAGSLASKVFMSGSFTEGWAHYAEQLAVENGLDHGSVHAEVAQIHDALLRDVRLIASIGLHTQGKDLEWATRLFESEAYFERLPSEREAIRGTFNPEYFCYTLGKLAILEARRQHLAGRFGGSLQRFHDTLLGFGCPPVGMLGELLSS
ncbi:MAG TPA: DUF885 domain-containing protein [Thermoplasmata archaeon]|nr:DUF885 domain-containing protein [Thermoplasmata archaeon]